MPVKGDQMDEERIEERVQTEEVALANNSEFAVVRKRTRKDFDPKKQEVQHTNSMRAVEDAIEQNDNSFDGVINNLPDEATGNASSVSDDTEAKTKASLMDEIKRQQEQAAQTVSSVRPTPRVLYTDGEERVL